MTSLHRINSLIPHLVYGDLRKQKILPKKALFTKIPRGGNFPSKAKSIGYAQFGVFIDCLIRRTLARGFNANYKHKNLKTFELYSKSITDFFGQKPICKYAFKMDKNYYLDIRMFVQESFPECTTLDLDAEWNYENISGHPDIVIDNVVYDIKTTGHFNKMRIPTIHQLLSYYCLAQQLNKNIDSIGLILPAQKQVIVVKLSDWDWKPFWYELKKCVDIKIMLQPDSITIIQFGLTVKPYVGSHISKNNSKNKYFSQTLLQYPSHLPWQIFFAGNTSGTFKISDRELANISQLIVNQGYRIYIHSPYTLNLSKRDEDNWAVNCLQTHLSTASTIGCKGVVVHCGVKKKNVLQEKAFNNMLTSVVEASTSATEDCPLLIETSAGETGELLSAPEELVSFYHMLSTQTKKYVKICVDTCHVFSAGYMPMDFIKILEDANVPIALIHFNDCKFPKGCCKDRHACPGTGYIGLKHLTQVGLYAIDKGIDMVRE